LCVLIVYFSLNCISLCFITAFTYWCINHVLYSYSAIPAARVSI